MRRILIALRNQQAAELISMRLMGAGFKTFLASSYESALGIYTAERPEFVLVELDFPPQGGDTFCVNIRQMFPDGNTFIMLACGGSAAELRRCGRSGADAYVEVPINAEEVSRRIAIILSKTQWRAPRVLIKVSVEGRRKSEDFFCTTQNISISGLLLETEKALARGDIIHCSFFLPDTERIRTDCAVMRVTRIDSGGTAYGVEFTNLDDHQRGLLNEFIIKQRAIGNIL